jgi:beta-ureidopropionase / N-carbamoyl-L-amino-acid hydrolase
MPAYLSTISALDGEQLLEDLEQLAQFGNDTGKGINRLAYSPVDRAGRQWVEDQMRALGMSVTVDALGNTIGVYTGSDATLRPIALGSHTDTVPDGGKYDGALGVLAALACVRTLYNSGFKPRHPVEIINFAAEEATMPGSTFGSRGMVGMLPANILQQAASDGRASAEVLRAAGLNPDHIANALRPPGSLAAYMELHIEQGGILDKAGIPIGIVQGIVGIRRYEVSFQGYANHAGTTPMNERQDALVAAAPFITLVHEVATRRGIVGTIGTLQVYPGAPNVIPGRVDLALEIRSLDDSLLDKAVADLEAHLTAQASLREISRKAPVPCDRGLLDAMAAACDELGLQHQDIASGAGHDAMCIAQIAPAAMLFVPSRNGVSHSPDEYTEPEDCVNGARVLLGALLRLDARLD